MTLHETIFVYVGIDGGRTKTEVLAESSKDQFFDKTYGPGNYHIIGKEMFSILLQSIVDDILEYYNVPSNHLRIVWGGAGVDTTEDVKVLNDLSISMGISILYVNDGIIALRANHLKSGGIIISGTGSVAWGHLFGDEGSGYEIGKQIINRCTKMTDGIIEPSALLEQTLKYFAISPEKFSDLINGDSLSKYQVARLVKLSVTLSEDIHVNEIFERVKMQLLEYVVFLHNRLPLEAEIALVGGILSNTVIGERLVASAFELLPNRGLFIATSSPVQGALKMAKESFK